MSHLVRTKDYSDAAGIFADAARRRALFYTRREEPAPAKPAPAPRARRLSLPQFQRDEVAQAFAAWMATAPAQVEQPWKVVCNLVCAEMQVPMGDLIGPTRVAKYTHARHVACWLMRRHTSMSLPLIGHRMGGRDHTTALNSVRRVEAMRERDGVFRALVDDLSAKIVERLPR